MNLRTKRNFKELQLPDVAIISPPAPEDPVPAPEPVRLAPGPKKRPPPLPDPPLPVPGFAGLDSAVDSAKRSARHASLSSTLAKLDLTAAEFSLKNEDLKNLAELGQGNGGSVVKVEHVPTGTIMAKKVRRLSPFHVRLVSYVLIYRLF